MFSRGFRPSGSNQHISVVKFSSCFLGKDDVIIFDRMRRKRNNSLYDSAGLISQTEADFAVNKAEMLVKKIEVIVCDASK